MSKCKYTYITYSLCHKQLNFAVKHLSVETGPRLINRQVRQPEPPLIKLCKYMSSFSTRGDLNQAPIPQRERSLHKVFPEAEAAGMDMLWHTAKRQTETATKCL